MSLDAAEAERRFDLEPADDLTPEQLFERRWGLTVMERAMAGLKAQSESGPRPHLFAALKPYLTGGAVVSQGEIAAELAMSVGAVKVAIHRLRQKYGSLLRREIAETMVDPSEVDDELRYLLNHIRPWAAG